MRPVQERYLALDVLRGLTIALMIVVNTPGSWSAIYGPFRHSDWNGCTVTDLVFPTFLFVVGNALSFSMRRLETLSNIAFLRKVLKRTVIIFTIGILLHAFPFVRYENGSYVLKDLGATRFWGVLQRIAVCYCMVSLVVYYGGRRATFIISILILFLYWGALYWFGTSPDPYSLAGNAVGRLDMLYLSPENMYKHYGIPFEPLGLLSTFPAAVNVAAGYLTGRFIQTHGNNTATTGKLFAAGVVMVIAGAVWGLVFPINKALWTSSYVVYATGFDLLILAVLIMVIDVWSIKKWTGFFEVFGKNPLFIYIISWMVIVLLGIIRINGRPLNGIIYGDAFASWLPAKDASLLFAVVYMLAMWIIGYVMDRKGIYVKV